MRLPMLGSFAQDGTRPHFTTASSRRGGASLSSRGGRIHHGVHVLGGRDVPIGLQLLVRPHLHLELLHEVVRVLARRVPPAHARPSSPMKAGPRPRRAGQVARGGLHGGGGRPVPSVGCARGIRRPSMAGTPGRRARRRPSSRCRGPSRSPTAHCSSPPSPTAPRPSRRPPRARHRPHGQGPRLARRRRSTGLSRGLRDPRDAGRAHRPRTRRLRARRHRDALRPARRGARRRRHPVRRRPAGPRAPDGRRDRGARDPRRRHRRRRPTHPAVHGQGSGVRARRRGHARRLGLEPVRLRPPALGRPVRRRRPRAPPRCVRCPRCRTST